MQFQNPVIEHIGGRAVAPSTTLTTATMNTGDSAQVKATNGGKAYIVGAWTKHQAAGRFQIRGQRLHDNNNGFSARTLTGSPYPLWPHGEMQEVFEQDTINYELSGSATGGDFELFGALLMYERLSGIKQNLIDWREYYARKKYVLSIENSITGGAGGGYTGETAINGGTVYNLKANTPYAVIGFLVNTGCCSVVWKGPDSGQTRIGAPAMDTNREVTREFFLDLSKALDEKTILVINSANGANTTVGVHCDENAGTFVVTTILAELR